MGQGWIGVHTGRTNPVVEEALRGGLIAGLDGYSEVTPEVTIELLGHARSRLDFRLTREGQPVLWIEVKNATLLTDQRIRFPDAVTKRGLKHLLLLEALVKRGDRGVILYAVNRPEGDCFEAAAEIDPDYAATLSRVVATGVEAVAVRIEHSDTGLRVGAALPLCLE